MPELSTVLRQRRQELGLTLAQIADKMGVAEATVQRWESGNIKTVRHEKIGRLAEILGVTPAQLMGWEENIAEPVAPPQSNQNIIRIAGRNGSYEERVLSDEQLSALKAIIDQMPDASDDL